MSLPQPTGGSNERPARRPGGVAAEFCTLCRRLGGTGELALALDHWPAAWSRKGRLTQDGCKRYGFICLFCQQAVRRAWRSADVAAP